jgi:hypothetical protein
MKHPLTLLMILALVTACGGDEGSPASEPDTVVSPDGVCDIAEDVADDIAPEVTEVDVGPSCEEGELPEETVSAEQAKYALSLFHFNIEYVVGGLQYVDNEGTVHSMSDVLSDPALVDGWDNDRVEDWIVTETFEPILDLYLAHPQWRVNIELQAYMIEVLAARHGSVLEKLHTLAWNGQVELISFHYSAQLFLAFPKEDLVRSIARTRQVFAEHCLPLSGVVFNQEGQAGPGWMRTLVEEGYSIGVYPKNLYLYVHEGVPMWPHYAAEGGTLVIGPGSYDPGAGVQIAWDFFDDGELRAVPDLISPYLAPLAGHDPARVAEFEAKLQAREDEGYILTTVSGLVDHLEARGVEKKPAPVLVDGTWQAKSTDSIHRWLGGRSDVFAGAEEDNRVRTGNAKARMAVAASQVLLEYAETAGVEVSAAKAEMASLWDLLFHAEISDASGVNPWRGEVLFALEANEELEARSHALQQELLGLLDVDHVIVDLASRQVSVVDAPVLGGEPQIVEAPLEVEVLADGRPTDSKWYALGEGRWRLTLSISAALDPDSCDDCDTKWVEVRFPRTHDALEYSPGLMEDEVVFQPLDGFTLQLGEVYLPLANGLIGLGDGRYVIKHVRRVHVAGHVAADRTTVDFIDETLPTDQAAVWVFELVDGTAEEALGVANGLNIAPSVTLSRD